MEYRKILLLTVLVPIAAASTVSFPVAQENIKFNSGLSLRSTQVADLLSALNGFTVHSSDAWKGIRSYNPLQHPSLFIVVDLKLPQNADVVQVMTGDKFPLENDNHLESEFDKFRNRAIEHDAQAEGTILAVDVDSESADSIAEASKLLDTEVFDSSVTEDKQFLLEYYTLKQTIALVNKSDVNANPSNFYWLSLSSLKTLGAKYGTSDKKTQRATSLFAKLLGQASTIMNGHPRSLLMVIQETSEPTVSRQRRQAETAEEKPKEEDLYLAHSYDKEFHATFAIVAFTMLVFVLGVFATSVGLWFMDPGRDSIIYRMTSQRMKME